METEKQTLEVRELDQRKSDRLTVTLWWVKGTIDTYVSIYDDRTKEIDYVGVPDGTAPQEVYNHPFAFQAQVEND